MQPHPNFILIIGSIPLVLCLLIMWIQSIRRKCNEKRNITGILGLAIQARHATTIVQLNIIIDAMLEIKNYPYSQNVEFEMEKLNQYIAGRKDGRPL